MTWSRAVVMLVAASFVGGVRPSIALAQGAPAQDAPGLAGGWALNRDLSQFPREVGFAPAWLPKGGPGPDSDGGPGGSRGSGGRGIGAFATTRQSEEDARRAQQLTAEVRTPAARLTIVQTTTAVTITDDQGRSRTVQPDGRQKVLQLDGVPAAVTAKWEAGRLVVVYEVEQARQVRYTFARIASPPQLTVDVELLERGRGDRIRRIYEPASAVEPTAAASERAVPEATPPATRSQGTSAPTFGAVSALTGRPAEQADQALDRRPGAELRGLTQIGVVVEDLTPQAAACGVNQGALETGTVKRLTDAGFRVRRNSDEDTYVYVSVITSSLSTGLCVSRYDVSLYTHTTARLSYGLAPVSVQVSLLHKGGLSGGTGAAHGEAVLRGVQESVDLFATQIRAANK